MLKPLLLSLLTMLSASVLAGNTTAPNPDAPQNKFIITAIQEKLGVKPTEIDTTPLPGIFQVMAGGRIVYVDATGRFMFDGPLIDLKTSENFSATKTDKISIKVLQGLNKADAVKTVKGNGSRTLITFEDANCGFCKKLFTETEKLDNVTIYTYLVQFLGEDSGVKAKNVWCSANQSNAWKDVMQNTPITPSNNAATCDSGFLGRNLSAAQQLSVTGTPTLFFSDGSRIGGYTKAENIEAKLTRINGIKPQGK